MVAQQLRDHMREVQIVADGGGSARDQVIRESWKRCVVEYGLDPTALKHAHIVTNRELKEHRERLDQLIRTARFGLESLYRQIADQRYVMLLTDARGVTVDYIGDAVMKDELQKAGLILGSEWKEQRAGTNGVGCCIYTGEALTVHQSDHFDGTHTPLTCTAAPIYDVNGKLAAVLDISALHSPEPKESQAIAFHLVKSYSRHIEMASLMAAFRGNWIIRFSASPEFLDVDPDCAVALSAEGRVVGMTHGAQRLLAASVGLDWRSPDKLIGERFESFFDYDVNNLPYLTRACPTEERAIGMRDGRILFANAMEPQAPPRARRVSTQLPNPLAKLHGGDPAMMEIAQKAARLAHAPISILLTGETGTGKEFLARAIHELRSAGKFVAINCAAVPEALIESELFGYEAGSFTGAQAKGKKGLIEQADGGTLFLDEIGDMPLSLQARLLRVLSEREVLRVGSVKPTKVDVRVLAATHRDLAEEVRNGRFREDLYYRLNGAVLNLPPLRAREDFDWLVATLLNGHQDPSGRLLRLSQAARALLRSHVWPGNIRELVNVLEFAKAFAAAGTIEASDLPDTLRPSPTMAARPAPAVSIPPAPQTGHDAETDALLKLLTEHHWNVSVVARALDVDRSTIHRRMNKAGLVPPNRR
ncbi:sigma-54-dependent Fis family transcriptional regulator [Phreatobacter sp. AB_2022a]|uniref:sigma-54-dependent Fis family transcriptional regulator n=1 Tax=Phreatobacter sp. AB_2022a TaxID=3003134 RepID=UPI00228720DC|nr:sigma-54-dependent Fis family transcriptional regulator [Phreatobacter sp. AB_2022a]MCZ0734883.1 sigma-54-dependent Fis family transcriptional regulator [Phreatobacter sp. AB_2022a]